MATVNMFSGLVRAEVRKAQAVIAELQLPAMKAGRSKEEAESLKSSYPSSPAKASWAEVKARREAEYRIANGSGSGNEYLTQTEWAEWKELTSLIPSTIRVGGAMYRGMKVTKVNLASLRASLATAKKAEAESLTRLANEFFNACIDAGIDVMDAGFEVSELSLRAQKMAVAESRRVFVYSLKLAEKSRLEAAGHEVWLDAGLCVANGSIQTREASAQSATRKGRYAHLKVATKYTAESHNWNSADFAKQAKEVKTLEVIEEKELLATVEEMAYAVEVAKEEAEALVDSYEEFYSEVPEEYTKLAENLRKDWSYYCRQYFKSLESGGVYENGVLVVTSDELVIILDELEMEITELEELAEESALAYEPVEVAIAQYKSLRREYKKAVADGGVFKTTIRHMLVVKPIEVETKVVDKDNNCVANLRRAESAQPHRILKRTSNSVIKMMVEQRQALAVNYLMTIVNKMSTDAQNASFKALKEFNTKLQRKIAVEVRKGRRSKKQSGKGRKNKN